MKFTTTLRCLSLALILSASGTAFGQALSTPPPGDNQKSVVTQYVGALAHVTVTWNSPDVTAPDGSDRTGHIWGELVPYGLTDLGFGLRNPAPWRAGANENTTIELSHDMIVQGELLPAGRYGFHVIAQKDEAWTVIFSNNDWAWGSFFYDEKEDALRVEVTPESNEHTEWLSFDFYEKQPTWTALALKWEGIRLPIRFELADWVEVYLSQFRNELQDAPGFKWENWDAAANFCLNNNTNLEEGLFWAEQAIAAPFIGQANFTTLQTKSKLLSELGRKDEAGEVMESAIQNPGTTPFQIHQYGRQLIGSGESEEALGVFKYSHNRFDGAWPTNVGLVRGYSAVGNYKQALKYAKLALPQAPDPLNKGSLEQMIVKLEKGEDIN